MRVTLRLDPVADAALIAALAAIPRGRRNAAIKAWLLAGQQPDTRLAAVIARLEAAVDRLVAAAPASEAPAPPPAGTAWAAGLRALASALGAAEEDGP